MSSILVLALLSCEGIVPPDTSLDTVPVAYFGGNYARRDDANIAMVAKMRWSCESTSNPQQTQQTCPQTVPGFHGSISNLHVASSHHGTGCIRRLRGG